MAPAYTLLSGATGFLGMHILKQLVEAGHRVRVITRSEEKGNHLRSTFREHESQIDTVFVGDQLAPNAYDAAAKGVDAIIHTAAPFIMTAKDNDEELIKPSVTMVKNMLLAAQNSPSVKRVILTSSLAAVSNPFAGGLFAKTTYTSDSWNPIQPDQVEGPALGYLASKTFAERDAWNFMKDKKPAFDLVSLCPGVIFGPPLQEVKSMDKLNTSCANVYKLLDVKEIPDNQFPIAVGVQDVARAHVRAIEVPDAGGKRFILSGGTYSFQLIIDAIRKQHPELKDRVIVGNPGVNEVKDKITPLDVSPATEILGIKFADWYESIIVQTVPAILKLEKELS